MTNEKRKDDTRRRTEERLARNDASRTMAEHHQEEWSAEEVALLEGCWGEVPLEEISETLGRTIEACRQFHYELGRKLTDRARKARQDAEQATRAEQIWTRGFTSLEEMERHFGER